MNKLNLISWDVLDRVISCLFNRHINYKVVITSNNDLLEKISIFDENEEKLFEVYNSLKINSCCNKTNEEITKCFEGNGIKTYP